MNGYPQGLLGALGLNEEDLRRQSMTSGLLNAGLQMLAASGPSPVRQSLGQIIAQGGAAGLQGMQQAQESAIDRALKSMQVQSLMQRQTQEQEAARRQADAMASLRAATQPVTAQSALAAPGRVGPTAERAAMVGQTPQFTREQALQLGLNPDLPKDLRESLFKYVEATTPKEPKAAPGIVGEYQAAVAAGLVPQETTLPQYVEMKKPPGTTVNVPVNLSTEKKFGEAFATQVAQEDVKLREAALSAPSQLDTIQQSRNLLEQGKVFTGAFANQKLRLAAAGQALGVTGKDTDEIVSNTQRLFANRAKATLDNVRASGLGAGQGFTDRDREFLEKAVLGNIEFTSEALKRQLEIEERVARGAVTKWNNRIKQLPRSTVEATGITPVDITAPQTSRVRRYNPATERVE